MPDKRDLKLEHFGISQNAYRELHYFCLQYPEKKHRLHRLTGLNDKLKLSVEQQIRHDLELIEQSAVQADSGIYQQLLENVTEGVCYWDLDVPCSKQYFYKRRQEFFHLLAAKKHMV